MPFPENSRFIYAKNQLIKVVGQLRFPPILKIETEIPSAFQERIRQDFPNYQEKTELSNQIILGKPNQLFINQITSRPVASKNHEFSSGDNAWKINLTKGYIALTTSNYPKWEDYRTKLKVVIDAVCAIYAPPFLTRIDLRYIDMFKRSRLGLMEVDWKRLLKPYILGALGSEVSGSVLNQSSNFDISLDDGESRARITSSLAIDPKDKEQCYVVDSNFYLQKKIEKTDIDAKFEFLHSWSSRLIGWVITDELHNAMEPSEA